MKIYMMVFLLVKTEKNIYAYYECKKNMSTIETLTAYLKAQI